MEEIKKDQPKVETTIKEKVFERTTNGDDSFTLNWEALATQCKSEYDVAWRHQKPKKDEWNIRLKLFNNQKRNKEAVGDTTMFTTFQTVLASLYADRLNVDFQGKEDGDEETADNLTAMAKSDYDDMEKDQLDYEWDWDTIFFGHGILSMEEYERDPDNNVFIPLPYNIDPIAWLRDPSAVTINGNRQGKGAMRFGGNELKITKSAMKENDCFLKDINFDNLKFGSSTYSLLEDSIQARDNAQGRQNTEKDKESNLGVNAQYTITQWFTHFEVGGEIKKVKVYLANDRGTVVGFKVFKRDHWPLVDRLLYPTSHDWDGTSVPDLTEDKQRARAIAQNLGLKAMKADLYPMYIYDTNKITNKSDLDFDFNKGIGVDSKNGEPVGNSIMPLNKARPNMQLLNFIFETLDISAQKATATPDIKQGIQSQNDRPLGETNLLASASDTRFSLSAKIFGWSEKRFWQQWYNLHKDNFADNIDEKILRIVGAFGPKWRPLSKQDIIARLDPDVFIESDTLSRAKQLEDRQLLTAYFSMALTDPNANRRWALKKLGKLNGMDKEELDRLYPPTIDERIAEDQNDLLNKNKSVPVLPEDDHNVHLEIHSKCKPTEAAIAHIETHKKALSIKKTKPELFPTDTTGTNYQQPGSTTTTPGGAMAPATATPNATAGKAGISPSDTSNQ